MSFAVERGELCAVLGPSGSGKTAVFEVLGGVEPCAKGVVMLEKNRVSAMTPWQRAQYRRTEAGLVCRSSGLIPQLTALENVELAAGLCANPRDPYAVLHELGMEKPHAFPDALLRVERRIAALARALVKNPKALLWDEPEAGLDYQSGRRMLGLIQERCLAHDRAVVVFTHNQAVSLAASRIIHIKDGAVLAVEHNTPVPADQIEW
jgi:putative ABC transport system ATP-binding protein